MIKSWDLLHEVGKRVTFTKSFNISKVHTSDMFRETNKMCSYYLYTCVKIHNVVLVFSSKFNMKYHGLTV